MMRRWLRLWPVAGALLGCAEEGTLEVEGGGPPADAAPPADDAASPAEDAAPPADDAAPAGDADAADAAPAEDAHAPDAAANLDAQAPDAAPPPAGPAIYPADRTLSPLTPDMVERLRALRAAHPGLADDVFAKIGDSGTVSTAFLHCFGGDRGRIDLAGRDALWPTIERFRAGDAAGTDPFRRESAAAVVGWSALHVLRGDPAPLDVETDALRPRFAVVMYGSNDIELGNIDRFAGDMLTIADRLLERGVIPVFSSVMPRNDKPESDAQVPSYNAVVRGVAQSRQVPFVDLHRELLPLPNRGIGPDGLHSSVYRPGGASRPCVFTAEGLEHGYNWRNLLTIQSLDRLARAVVDGEPAPDASAPVLRGEGAPDDPFLVEALPFTDVRDTRDSPHANLDGYPGCDRGQDESGPEYVYRFDVARPTTVRAFVLDRDGTDVDLHLLGDAHDGASCVARHDRTLEADLAPGTWWFVVDTYVGGGGPRAGEFLFVVLEE
jgi:hypothetical protein